MKLRHQLAVYSPITASSLLRAVGAASGIAQDSRATVSERLRGTYGAEGCVLCDSGTHALQLAIEAARRITGEHSRIALPAFNCFDVATAAIACGGEVSLYDIDPATLTPDVDSVEAVLAAGARVLVVAPLYGIPLDWESLDGLARRFGAVLIEDAAQGHGGAWKGRTIGSMGGLSTLSFGRGKGWTSGGGGALLLRDSLAMEVLPGRTVLRQELSTVAGLGAQWLLGRPSIYGVPHAVPALHLGETTYVEPSAPRTMTRSGAAALTQNEVASREEGTGRRQRALTFINALQVLEGVSTPSVSEDAQPGYLRLPIRVRGGMNAFRDAAGARRLGVVGSYPITLADLGPLQRSLVGAHDGLAGARELARDLITLPTHSLLRVSERETIIAMLREATHG